MASLLSQVANPLLSGLTNVVANTVQTSVETAIAVAATVYASLGSHKTSALDVRHEFATLSATIDQTISVVHALPDPCPGDYILGQAPKGVAICAAISRTTACIKSLPGPVSQEDGIAIINSYKEVQAKVTVLMLGLGVRVTSIEHGAPGICEYGFNRLLTLFEALTQALLNVLPPSINADEVQGVHKGIESACNGALTSVRSATNVG